MRRKRSAQDDPDADLPMRKFKRPYSGSIWLCTEATKFDLNILISEPDHGNRHHWALQLYNLSTRDGTIFEIQGAHPFYEFSTYQCRLPYYSLKILKSIPLGQFILSPASLGSICHAIEHQVPLKNDVASWNCQDYVFEALQMLEDEWWLDTDDDEYVKTKKKLKSMRGPMDAVRALVIAYPGVPASGAGRDNNLPTNSGYGGHEKSADARVEASAEGEEAEPKKVRWAIHIER